MKAAQQPNRRRLTWQRSQVRPITFSLHSHWPLVASHTLETEPLTSQPHSEGARKCQSWLSLKPHPLGKNIVFSLSFSLTTTILGLDGVAVVTGLAHLAVGPTGVAPAAETRSRDDITVPCLTHVHVVMALAAHAGPAHFLWVPVEAAGTPVGETYRQTDRCVGQQRAQCDWLLGSVAPPTSHSWPRCSPPDTGHMTPGLRAPAHRWD